MSCKSAMYTVNANAQTLAIGDTVDPGLIIRRFGQNVNKNDAGLIISGTGYYDVDAEITLLGTASGTAVVTLLKDGVAVPGANASVGLAAGSVATIGINSLIREMCCCDPSSVLTLTLTGVAATVTNAAVVVEKI